jgi:hypothetical protein
VVCGYDAGRGDGDRGLGGMTLGGTFLEGALFVAGARGRSLRGSGLDWPTRLVRAVCLARGITVEGGVDG